MPKHITPAGAAKGGSAVAIAADTEDVWLSRSAALAYLTEKLGRPVGVTTLVYSWAISYHKDGRNSVYRKSTLDRFIADHRERVGQQVFGGSTRRAA